MTDKRFEIGMSAKVFSEVMEDGRISINTDLGGQIYRRVIDTEDHVLRQALVSLGWTPPDEPPPPVEEEVSSAYKTIRAVVECRVPHAVTEKDLVRKMTDITRYPLKLGHATRGMLFPVIIKSFARVLNHEKTKWKREQENG